MTLRFGLGVAAALVAVVLLACASVAYGSTVIPIADVLTAIGRAVGLVNDGVTTPVDRIVVDLRLPRAILAIAVGAGLGVIGLLLQTVTRNDLADPFLFGLSAGAAAGAVAVITRIGDRLGLFTLPIAAFAGGMLATGVVLMLIRRAQGYGPERLVLAGLASPSCLPRSPTISSFPATSGRPIRCCSGPWAGWGLRAGRTSASASSAR